MISFNTIPLNLLTPGVYVEVDSSKATSGLALMPHRILVIAPRLQSAAVLPLVPTRVFNAAAAERDFGRGSIGAAMILAARAANQYTELWAIGVADHGSGVAATGTLTVTGPATGGGALQVYIAGKRVSVAVASSDSQNAMAAALSAAINADTSLPVTASVAANVVTTTARNKGTTGNDIDLRANYNAGDMMPAGVAVAIVAMANGATNPDMATVTAALGDSQFHTIVSPWNDATSLTVLETFLATCWEGTVQKEGHAFAGVGGSHATVATLASGRNSPHLTLIGNQRSPTPPWVFAAALAAQDASQAESPANSNRPRKTLPLTSCLPPKESDRYTRIERNAHLASGCATFIVDDGGVCRIERAVTTYKTANGVPDTAFRDVEMLRGIMYLRYSTRVRIALRYPRHKIASDGYPVPPGQPIVTPSIIRDELVTLFMDWMGLGLVEDLETFKRELLVERNTVDENRVDAIIPPKVIRGFLVFAAQVQFR